MIRGEGIILQAKCFAVFHLVPKREEAQNRHVFPTPITPGILQANGILETPRKVEHAQENTYY